MLSLLWTWSTNPIFLDQDIADKVTAEWKVMYKECSAKDPEAVTDLFKSVMVRKLSYLYGMLAILSYK